MKKRGFGKAGGVGGALLAVLLLTISPSLSTTSSSAPHHMTAFCALTHPTLLRGSGLAQCMRRPPSRGSIWASTALRMVAEDAREERVALGASATVAELVLEDRQGAMAVAGIRAQAFARGAAPSPDAFIETRYALFEAVRLRMGKGATCLTASLPVPPPDGLARAMLLRLGEAPDLQAKRDRDFDQEYRKLGTELASGAIPQEGYEERLSEAVAAWTEVIPGEAPRKIVTAAVDLSTHEFALASPEWEAAFGGASSYISDLGVHPAFRRLGLAASLCAATLARARDRDFTDVFLHVEETNTAARALYEAFGFSAVEDCPAALKLYQALALDQGPLNLLYRLRLSEPLTPLSK